MIDVLILALLLVSLTGLRSLIQRNIQAVVMLFGGDSFHGILVYSLVFLPGIMVHEMSHFFAATIMGVRTGNINLFPRRGAENDGRIALGSVQVAKSDFVRSSLIGAAPFVVGSIVLYVLVAILLTPIQTSVQGVSIEAMIAVLGQYFSNPRNWLGLYLIFAVANTMFMSKEDARAFPVIAVFIGLIGGVLIATGNLERLITLFWPRVHEWIVLLSGSFLAAVILDLIAVGALSLFVVLMQKLTKKRVVYGG